MFHDHSDLLCQQIFCLFAVTGLVEVVHQRFTLVDPSHQVVHRYLGFAVRKIEHGQFGLTVTFYLKHNGWVFIVFVFSHRCFLTQIFTSHVLKHTDFIFSLHVFKAHGSHGSRIFTRMIFFFLHGYFSYTNCFSYTNLNKFVLQNPLSMLISKCFDHYFHFKLRFYIQG